MKFACELIVNEVLPVARRELAVELVRQHDVSQVDVAKMFGVTPSAISQYLKGVRGVGVDVVNTSFGTDFTREIEMAAERLAEGKSNIVRELCAICNFTKASGILEEINIGKVSDTPYCTCKECPNTDYDGNGTEFTGHMRY